jgi:uncharacterized protein (DUF2147 family)
MPCRAATMVLACMLSIPTARAHELTGEWATEGYSARVRIGPCDDAPERLCGEIVWLWEPTDANGTPLRDAQNPRFELRQRPLIGLPLLKDFRRSSSGQWHDGTIYDPESGRTYRATLSARSSDILEVAGCVLFVCRTQLWRRTSSLCPYK